MWDASYPGVRVSNYRGLEVFPFHTADVIVLVLGPVIGIFHYVPLPSILAAGLFLVPPTTRKLFLQCVFLIAGSIHQLF